MPLGVQEEISKMSKNSQGRAPAGVKLQSGIAYIKSQSKGYSVNFINKEAPTERLLHKYFLVSFEHIFETASETMSKKQRVGYLQFGYVFFINMCFTLHQNNSDLSERAW